MPRILLNIFISQVGHGDGADYQTLLLCPARELEIRPCADLATRGLPSIPSKHPSIPCCATCPRRRTMAAVNQNMFDASIAMDRPGGSSLMVLPLNLIAEIVSNVSVARPQDPIRHTDHRNFVCRSRIPAISRDYVEHVVFSITWPFRSSTDA